MRAFVIRGFGQKAGVDFERVHQELIAPALAEAGIDGGDTAKVIVQDGSIHKDMFRELVMADIVVADVSVHDANVFYELGIRHTVRPRSTVLIYARIDEVPFDLMTYRYMPYDAASPAAAKDQLVQVLRDTLAFEDADSPIFELLPEFVPGVRTTLLGLPRSLAEDIEQAREARRAGELRLIADEVMGLRFEEAALRAVAQASEHVGDEIGAQRAWERIRDVHPDDLAANYALADIYRRLGNLVLSDQALTRALGSGTLTKTDRAELLAGLGSNSKRRWVREWRGASEEDKARVALQFQERGRSLDFYRRGFDEDLNHLYAGLNALGLTKVTLELAGLCLDDWRTRFDTEAEADWELERLRSDAALLASAVQIALNAARSRARYANIEDVWIDVSVADFRLLTSNKPKWVTSAYESALSRLSPGARRAVREQVEMYRDLGVFADNVAPTLDLLGEPEDKKTIKVRPLVFSGHKIDVPGRATPRFPAKMEEMVKAEITKVIRAIKVRAGNHGEQLIGMAGAADGGDLLFHEVCAELGIDTEVFLPVPELAYRASATSGWPGWVERYHAVLRLVSEKAREQGKREDGVHVLARADRLPTWLQDRAGYSTWQRSNRWVLHHAWATTTVDRVTMLALWNGEPGDGPGGTANMVETAQASGAEVIVLGSMPDASHLSSPQLVLNILTSSTDHLSEDASEMIEPVSRKGDSEVAVNSSSRDQVFISYSHADGRWLKQLRIHLEPYIRNEEITVWDDTMIKPGETWKDSIRQALASAKVAVLLVSPTFLASKFIAEQELPPLLEAAKSEGVSILWVPVRPSSYKHTPIADYQAVHSPEKPLITLSPGLRDRILVKICEAIHQEYHR